MKIYFDSKIADYSEIFRDAFLGLRDGETVELEHGIYPISGERIVSKPIQPSNNDFAYRKVLAAFRQKVYYGGE